MGHAGRTEGAQFLERLSVRRPECHYESPRGRCSLPGHLFRGCRCIGLARYVSRVAVCASVSLGYHRYFPANARAAVCFALLVASAILVSLPQRDPTLWALDTYNSGWHALEMNDLVLAEKK